MNEEAEVLKQLCKRFPGTCYASVGIVESGNRIKYAVRGEPDEENSSGWRFFDAEEETPDGSNSSICDLAVVCMLDTNAIRLILGESAIGESFRIEETSGDFFSEVS